MKLISIFIPGMFDDAFVYMGRLLAFTTERTLRVWNLDLVTQQLQTILPTTGEVSKWIFSRNDWLTSGQFHSLMKTPGVFSSVLNNINRFPQPFVEIAPNSYHQEFPLKLSADHLLDVVVYGGRLYIATDKGLYDIRLDWEFGGEITPAGPRKRLDAKCISTSAAYGAVLASCGDDGLFAATNEFSNSDRAPDISELKHATDRSIRTAWLGDDVVNYGSAVDPKLLRAQYRTERVERDEERVSKLLVGMGQEKIALNEIFGVGTAKHNISRDDIQFVFNSSRNFFLNTYSGRFFGAGVADISVGDAKQPRLRYLNEYSNSGSRIISAAATRVGVVFERDTDVAVWSQNSWQPMANEPVISMRTFIKSKRYQNLVVLTLTKGLQLTGLFDEEAYGTFLSG